MKDTVKLAAAVAFIATELAALIEELPNVSGLDKHTAETGTNELLELVETMREIK